MKKIFLLLSFFIFLLSSCNSPKWHKTSQGYYIYGVAKDKYNLVWEGSVQGCLVDGDGTLISYNKEGKEEKRLILN